MTKFNFKRFISKVLITCFLLNNLLGFLSINNASANDTDGSAHLDLHLTKTLSNSGVVVGKNFNFGVNLKNTQSSEGDAYKYSYILSIPTGLSYVSSDLGTPSRTLSHNSGSTLYFFKTSSPIIKGVSKDNTFVLNSSSGSIGLSKDIKILAYANDNIYGVGKPPAGSPPSTLTGGIDFADSSYFTGSSTFPDNIDASFNLNNLPFQTSSVTVKPFDVTKTESSNGLVGGEVTTTITITNNNLGPISNLNIQDILPKNRKFIDFTQTGGVKNSSINYDLPSNGYTTINLDNIDVNIGETLEIKYKSILLSHELLSYTGGIIFDSGSYTQNHDTSINTAITHTGNLSSGMQSYWNNGTNNILVNSTTLPGTKTYNSNIDFAKLTKSVDKSTVSIGDIVTYTLNISVGKEFDLISGNSKTYINDLLPDGLSFSGVISSQITSGSGGAFSYSGVNVDSDGNSNIEFILNNGDIEAGSVAQIKYQAVVDGNFEGNGVTSFVNNDTLTNTATLTYEVGGNNYGEWGFTENSLVGNTYTSTDSSSIKAPSPIMNTQLIKAVIPGGQTYNNLNPIDSNTRLSVGSELTFAITADFPKVDFKGIIIKNALPLLSGPNTEVYGISFQNDTNLKDINGNSVEINDNNGDGNFDNSFNGNILNTSTLAGNSWITTSNPNNLVFNLGNGSGGNTFSILFTVKILPTAPETIDPDGLHPLLNVTTGEYSNGGGILYSDLLKEVPFTIAIPKLNITKTASGSNIGYGSHVDYTINITNSGAANGFAENILDVIPENMTLSGFSITNSGSSTNLPGANITQNGTGLNIEFSNEVGTYATRQHIPIDNTSTSEKENIIVIKYSLYPNQNFVIGNPTSRTNTVSLDYYATKDSQNLEVNNYGPISAQANFTTASPTILRSLNSTSLSDSTTNNLYIGEEATFDTAISFSGGTYLSGYYIDSMTDSSYFKFLTGSIVDYSGSLNFDTNATFSSTGYINFGNIVNTDSDNSKVEKIILRTTYRLETNATANTNRATTSKFYYSGLNIQSSTNVNYRTTQAAISKTVSGSNVDASDVVKYTIKVTNSSTTAHGYDYNLKDILPSGVDLVPGSLSGNVVFSGSENDLFNGSGIYIDVLNPSASGSIWYNATISTGAVAGSTKNNIVNLSYTSLPDDDSIYEKTYTGSSNVNLTIKDISISHQIDSTNLTETNNSKFNVSYPDVAIGEEVTYKVFVNLAELNYSGVTLTQTVNGLQFTSGSILNDNVIGHSLNNITLSGSQIIYNFGDIQNLGGTGTGFILQTKGILLDSTGATAGTTKTSSVTINYNSTNSKTDSTPIFDIVEPNLAITKTYATHSGDAGDQILTTINVTNNGTAPAYDLTINDETPSKLTAESGYYSSTGVSVLNPGESVSYSYNSTIKNTVIYGDLLTGTSSVIYDSYPLSNGISQRNYSTSDTDSISITGLSGLSKTLMTNDTATIGDKITYKIAFPIPEGTTNNVKITDYISTGTIVIPGSINITTSNGVTYSGGINPAYSIESNDLTANQSQNLVYDFSDIINSDSDNNVTEFIYIQYDVSILNNSDNTNGTILGTKAKADYENGVTTLNATALNVQIVEPKLSFNISNNYSSGHTVDLLFTITNNGTSPAYDIDLNTILSSGLSYSGNLIITNSGNALNLNKSGNNFSISSLPVNTGNPLTFKVSGKIDDSINDKTILKATGSLTYTSINGNLSTLTSNSSESERNGSLSIALNNYLTGSDTNFTTAYPLLNEYINVDYLTGSILDKFTYTITLENTGSLNLNGINVSLNIPSSFSGFNLVSFPGGSEDLSNSTGGINNSGYLYISGITLPIGQSTTIVYEVYAKNTVLDGTKVNSIANVGDSIEGAKGGTPNVEVTILAPKYTTSATLTDVNGGKLYVNDYITHNITLKNIGSSTGTNVEISLNYQTGFTYNSGSISFATGTIIDTGSVIIDETNKQITFNIPYFYPNNEEVLSFQTIATGNVGDTNYTDVGLISYEGISNNSTSNKLVISSKSSGGGGGGAISKDYCVSGDYSGSYYDGSCGTKPTTTTDKNPNTTENNKKIDVTSNNNESKNTSDNKNDSKDNTNKEDDSKTINEINDVYKKYIEDKKKLEYILAQESTEGNVGFKKYPTILPKTGSDILSRTYIKNNNKLNLSVDNSATKLAGNYNTDINYWKEVLPQVDKNSQEIIVTPSNGMVIPIVNISSFENDYNQLISGNEIEVNKYLKNGALKYPGTGVDGYGNIGNTVIFGHSSYFKKDNGRYKTLFQKIINLDEGEQIWIYKKQNDGNYKRYIYIVEKTFEVDPKNTSVLNAGIGKNLTLFTCTPIGGINGRWVVQAKYYDETKIELESRLYGQKVSLKHKNVFENFIKKFEKLSNDNKKIVIIKTFKVLNLEKTQIALTKDEIDYFKLLLVKALMGLK